MHLVTRQDHQRASISTAYENQLDRLAHFRQIKSVDEPLFVSQWRDRMYKLPLVQEILKGLTPELLEKVEKLEAPRVIISTPGIAFEESVSSASRAAAQIPSLVSTSRESDLNADETGDLISWNPNNPRKGKSKLDQLKDGTFSGEGFDILIADGHIEVPDFTRGLDGYELSQLCSEQGFIQLHRDAYFSLQLQTVGESRHFDYATTCTLDAYSISREGLTFGQWGWHSIKDDSKIFFWVDPPSTTNPFMGTRRAVRVKIT
jgi:hypothetical protein